MPKISTETPLKDELEDGTIDLLPEEENGVKKPLRVRYDKIIKMLDKQEGEIKRLRKEVELLKRVLTARR